MLHSRSTTRTAVITAIAAFAACLALAGQAPGSDGDEITGTFPVDPVALVKDGREVAGREDLALEHHRYRYLFATEANRDSFLIHPARYEIQLGGACGRMGPLSGAGRTDLYAVHDGRIYIFASEGCRTGFLAAPEKLLDRPDPVPAPDDDAARRGRELIEQAVEAVGGAARLDALRTYRLRHVRVMERDGAITTVLRTTTVRFPDSYRRDARSPDGTRGHVATTGAAFFVEPEGNVSMHPSQRAALEKDFAREVLVILRARHRDDFVAAAAGPGRAGGLDVELVEVAFRGATSTLGVDPRTGVVRSIEYRGRGPRRAFGTVKIVFDEFRRVGGLLLPATGVAAFDGEPDPQRTFTGGFVEVNGGVADEEFALSGG
ncbi:MAG: hypothetical protein ACYTG1_02325 [Planctomycetota bacterium]|jgi:YHS domain-containing protein